MPVLAASPDAPLGDQQQRWLAVRQCGCNPVGDIEEAMSPGWVNDSFYSHAGNQIWLRASSAGQPGVGFLFGVKAQIPSTKGIILGRNSRRTQLFPYGFALTPD